jgi:hypothetical protein
MRPKITPDIAHPGRLADLQLAVAEFASERDILRYGMELAVPTFERRT